jgi:sulfate adenylyltransferase subunit 1
MNLPAQPPPLHPPDLLRLLTAGSVDDGKSTLVCRLLLDSKAFFDDQLAAIERLTEQRGEKHLNLALVTDGLRAKREQGITIDVAYRYFATPRPRFIIADTPGHIQYTRNMVTGASTAQLAVLLVDVRNGLTEQTCRHTLVTSLLHLQHLVICINKMDLVDWAEEPHVRIVREFTAFASRLEIPDIKFIPISALQVDNVVEPSSHLPWYKGGSLLETLETVYIGGDQNHIDARFPVQTVIRPNNDSHHDFRGLAGSVASGVFKPGDEVIALPSGLITRVRSISGPTGEIAEAFAPMAVVMTLADDLDVSRGDLLAKPHNQPRSSQDLEAMLCWLSPDALQPNRRYLLLHTTRELRCVITTVRYKIDFTTLHKKEGDYVVGINDIARVHLHASTPVLFDTYNCNRTTGSFILVDESTNDTLAAGLIIESPTAVPV